MKKIVSYLIVGIVALGSIGNTHANIHVVEDAAKTATNLSSANLFIDTSVAERKNTQIVNKARKVIIIEGRNLVQTANGRKYKQAIDTAIPKASTQKLSDIKKRTSYVLSITKYTGELLALVKYLDAKVTVQLQGKTTTENSDKTPVVSDTTQVLTASEKASANTAIIALQTNIYNTLSQVTKNVETSLQQATNVSETGAFEMNVEANHESFGYVKYQIEADKYESHQNGLDQVGKTGDMNLLFNMKDPNGEEMKLDLLTNLETIQKSGDMYLLLKKFVIQEQEGLQKFDSFTQKLTEFVQQNKYIHITDTSNKKAYEVLKHMSSEGIMQQFSALNTTPMFDIKGKVGSKYIIEPNTNFCTFINSFPGNSHIDCITEFPQVVAQMNKYGTLSLQIGATGVNILAYEGIAADNTKLYFTATYTQTELEKMTFLVTPSTQKSGLKISYEKHNHLIFDFKDQHTGTMNITAHLNNDNTIKNANIDIRANDIEIIGNYVNNHLSLNLTSNTNYATAKGNIELDFVRSIPTNGTITMKVESIDYHSGMKKTTFDTNISINNKTISGTTHIPEVVSITHSGKIDDGVFQLDNSITFGEKLQNLLNGDYVKDSRNAIRKMSATSLSKHVVLHKVKTGKYPTKAELQQVQYYKNFVRDPKGNIEINDCKFGYTYEIDEEKQTYRISYCTENKGEKQYEGNFDKSFTPTTSYNLSGYTTWEKVSEVQEKPGNITAKLNFDINTKNNNNNIIIEGNLKNNNETMFSLFMKNISKKEYNTSVEIKKPERVIDMKEFISDFYNY